MAEIIIQPDCGNSPRKLLLKNLNIAIAGGHEEFVAENIDNDIYWNIKGHTVITGKENYIRALKSHKLWNVKKLTVDSIITHGADASVSGNFLTSGNLKYAFCDIYKFKSAGNSLIKSISTFLQVI